MNESPLNGHTGKGEHSTRWGGPVGNDKMLLPATGVQLADGSRIEADLVVAGIGTAPYLWLAAAAGWVLENGAKVDQHLRSEHWFNAFSQPAVATLSMVGRYAVSDKVQYLHSDQDKLGMECSSHVQPGDDEVVFRGDRGSVGSPPGATRAGAEQPASTVFTQDSGALPEPGLWWAHGNGQ